MIPKDFDDFINNILNENLFSPDIEATVEFVDKASQTIFASIWADWIEENAKHSEKYRNILSGNDILEIAPDYKEFLKKRDLYNFENKTYEMIAKFEEANGRRDILDLYQSALRADGQTSDNVSPSSTPEMFGFYVLMQMLGHGISWNDDHKNPKFVYPHFELSYLEFPDSFAEIDESDEARAQREERGDDIEEWGYEDEDWKDDFDPNDDSGEEWKK